MRDHRNQLEISDSLQILKTFCKQLIRQHSMKSLDLVHTGNMFIAISFKNAYCKNEKLMLINSTVEKKNEKYEIYLKFKFAHLSR